MHNLRKRHGAAFKAKVALEAAKGEKLYETLLTREEMAWENGVGPS